MNRSIGIINNQYVGTTTKKFILFLKHEFSTHKSKLDFEPQNQVTRTPYFNPIFIKVPYLRENQRREIFQKYKEDPTTWTTLKLAQHFGATETRIKAVIYLMEQREVILNKNNAHDITARHQEIYQKSLDKANTIKGIAESYELSESEVQDIVNRVGEHTWRLKNMKTAEKMNAKTMKHFSEIGANVKFQESPNNTTNNFESNYFPTLFGDEKFEEVKRHVFKNLERETKARLMPHPGLAFLRENFGKSVSVDIEGNISGMEILPPSNPRETNPGVLESKFKYAIRDISFPPSLRKTIIRTRDGRFRMPTPTEELARSWVRRPSVLDRLYYEKKIAEYNDPDGDEMKVVEQVTKRLERRKALKAVKST